MRIEPTLAAPNVVAPICNADPGLPLFSLCYSPLHCSSCCVKLRRRVFNEL